MASAEFDFLAKINENFLVCGICTDRYKSAKALPCLHSFCEKCLLGWVEKSGKLDCPVCRRTHQLPPGGVTKLQSNFFLDQLVEQFNQRYIGITKSNCDGCDGEGDENDIICVECSMRLCSICARTHKRVPLTRSHRLMPVDEYRFLKSNDPTMVQTGTYCEHHTDNQIKFYCETCEVPICSDCTVIDHRIPQHNHKYLKDAATEYKFFLEMSITKLKVKERETEDSIAAIQKMVNRLDGSFYREERKLNDHVTKTITEMSRIIEGSGKLLLKQLKDEYDVRKSELTAQLKDLDGTQHDIANACEYTENLIQYGNPAQMMSTKKGVAAQTRELLKVETNCSPMADDFMEFQPYVYFCKNKVLGTVRLIDGILKDVPQFTRIGDDVCMIFILKSRNNTSIDDIAAEITDRVGRREKMTVKDNKDGTFLLRGRVHAEGEYRVFVTVCEQLVCSSALKVIPKKGFLYKLGSTGKAQGELRVPWGLSLDGKGNVIVCESECGNRRIQSFALQSKRGEVMKCSGYWKPYIPQYIAVSINQSLNFVTDTGNNKVLVFDVNWDFIRSFKGGIRYPRGIAISPINNHVYVVDQTSHCLRMFNQDGNQIKSFGSQGSDVGQFKSPEDVCVNNDGRVIVSDRDNHRIQVFDADGKFLFAFGNGGNWDSRMINPYGVTTDKHDNVYVCACGNKRVLKFDSKGNYICRVDSGKEINPVGICVTDDEPFGRVIVSDSTGNCIWVFQV